MTGIRKRKNNVSMTLSNLTTCPKCLDRHRSFVCQSSPLDRSPMSHYSNRYFYRSAWINLSTYKRVAADRHLAIWRAGMLLRCPPDWTSWYVNQDRRKLTSCGEDERQDIGGWLRRRTVNCEPSCCESVARQEIAVAW